MQANTIPLHGDARATIEALLPFLTEAEDGDRPSPVEAVRAARSLIAYYDIRLKEPQYAVLEAIQGSIPEDAFIVWDVTQFGYYARTHYKVKHPKTYIDSGYQFNLGYAFPTALGAKVAKPDRPVLCMAGYGGFMFNSSELLHGGQVRDQRYDRGLQKRLLRQRRPRPQRLLHRNLRDRSSQPGLRQVCRVVRRSRHERRGSCGPGNADSAGAGTSSTGGHRRTIWEMPIPRAPQITPLYALPWTQPQEGLIG